MTSLNLIHRVRLPNNQGPPRRPAVVFIHGWTGDERSMQIFSKALPEGVAAIYPRGPVAAGEGYGWFDRHDGSEAPYRRGLEALQEFVAGLAVAYPVDPARLVLVGFSQGGAMSQALALAEPWLTAGLAVLAGYLPAFAREQVTPGRLTGKPVFMAHGVKDETVPVADARSACNALTLAGADVTYHEYPTGHRVNRSGMHDLKQWLSQHV
jgi:phospholipase/carboxylesterase